MAERKLRNEETQAGKEIWAAVGKAAARAPEWVKQNVVKIAKETLLRSSKVAQTGVMPNTPRGTGEKS